MTSSWWGMNFTAVLHPPPSNEWNEWNEWFFGFFFSLTKSSRPDSVSSGPSRKNRLNSNNSNANNNNNKCNNKPQPLQIPRKVLVWWKVWRSRYQYQYRRRRRQRRRRTSLWQTPRRRWRSTTRRTPETFSGEWRVLRQVSLTITSRHF